MRIRNNLIAATVLLALGFSGQAWSQQNEEGPGANNSVRVHDYSYSGNNRDNTTIHDSFNTSNAVATTALVGAVTGNAVYGNGNIALNNGHANGGSGGAGGVNAAVGGYGSGGDGGDGGDALAASLRDGDSASANISAAIGLGIAYNDPDSSATSTESGRGSSAAGSGASGNASASGGASASGSSSSTNDGSSGDAWAYGGYGGYGGDGHGGYADASGANGGDGGDGGSAWADAGSFNMSNAMNGSANAAAGIMVLAQNSGAASLIQQGVTVQANLNVGQ